MGASDQTRRLGPLDQSVTADAHVAGGAFVMRMADSRLVAVEGGEFRFWRSLRVARTLIAPTLPLLGGGGHLWSMPAA